MSAQLIRQLPIDPMKGTWYHFLDGDPSVAGFASAVDSLALRVDTSGLGKVYKKTGAPDTGWTEITGGNSSAPVATTAVTGTVRVDNDSAGDPQALTAAGHLLAADPHSQYALDSEKGAASGIATLDGASKLTASQLPLGTSSTTAAAGNDARLGDARTPVAHGLESAAGFHTASGLTIGWVLRATGASTFAMAALQASDIPNLAESQVTNLVSDLAGKAASVHTHVESDITGLVADLAAKVPTSRTISTTAPLTGGGDLSANRTLAISDFVASGASHARGAVPDPGASAGTVKFLREDATWSTPVAAASPVESYDVGTQSLATEQFILQYQHLKLSSTERLTLAGTSEMYVSDYAAYSPSPVPFADPATISRSQIVYPTDRVLRVGPTTIAPGVSVTVLPGGVMEVLPVVSDFVASGTAHAGGLVPDPGATSGITRFLREDGWTTLPAALGSYRPGSLSLASEQTLMQYQHVKLTGSQRLTMAGTSEMLVTDFGAYSATVLGKPKTPTVSFTVPADYYLDIFTRLTLSNVQRATLAGTADLILTDDFGTRSRITLAGRG